MEYHDSMFVYLLGKLNWFDEFAICNLALYWLAERFESNVFQSCRNLLYS